MRPLLLDVLREHADPEEPVCVPSPAVASVLIDDGWRVLAGRVEDQPSAALGGVVLVDDELGHSGEHAEGLLAQAARVLRPGGLLAVSARGRIHAEAIGVRPAGRAFSAAELAHALGHRGFGVEVLAAPGAATGLRGVVPAYDPELDRHPGLLDSAEHLVALARWAPDEATRSERFFASLPRKVVAASVVCRDREERLLLVFDSYKRHWTLPGGVVDADEDPRAAAEREAWEEAGVRVRAGRILGVFSGSWPDRVVLVYEARLTEPAPTPVPVHHHEVDAVSWMALDEAIRAVPPHVAFQITRSIRQPGGSWRQ
ncbi:MAG TPA: NUDIX hydrolase [Egibacteraceae bacterium]|nr:NUDIX hydrolase [Egibacteraceae bacterium]